MKRVVGYLRVSTDDKGQDPGRQRDVIQRWADRTDAHGNPTCEVVAWVTDEGTSGATDPFQRQMVREALELAERFKADGIAVESVDRWTRSGTQALAMSEFFLNLDHKLSLEIADLPPGMDAFTREIITSLMAACAKEFRRRLREQIKSGLDRARAQGWPRGRPGRRPKPSLTEAEQRAVWGMVLEEGLGVDRVALELSKLRGAWNIADRTAQDKLRVCPTWLWKQIHANMPEVAEVLGQRRVGVPRGVRQRGCRKRTVQKALRLPEEPRLASLLESEPGAKA